jgi:hypothetical protein
MTTRGWTFSLSSRVAAVCRPSWRRTVADAGLSRCRALGVGAGRLNCAVAGIVEGR